MIIKNSFPSAIEKERIRTLEKFDLLYNNRQQEVLLLHNIIKKQYRNFEDLVYLGHAIPAKISDFYGDFVQGDVEAMTLTYVNDDANISTFEQIVEDNDIAESIHDWATDQSTFGFEVLLGYVQDGKFYIQDVECDQYFPQSETEVVFATYFRDTLNTQGLVDETVSSLLLYTQLYTLVGNKVTIERQVWSTDADGVAADPLGENVLTAYFGTKPTETIENMDMLPIVQIDNGKRTRWGFGKSDYADIMPQLAEINERRTHIATQLLKNLDAKIELPERADMKQPDGTLKYFEYIMRADKTEPETRYITNDNPLLEATEKHITSQLQMISYITDVPMWSLLETSQPERVESMKIKLFSALRKTDRKRMKMKRGVEKIIEIGFKMLNKEMAGDVVLVFSDVLPNDILVDVQVEEQKVNAGLSSRRSAMRRLENYTEEELDAEMLAIRNEDVQSGAVNPNNPPSV